MPKNNIELKEPKITKRKYKPETAEKKVKEINEYFDNIAKLPVPEQLKRLNEEYAEMVQEEIDKAALENTKKKIFGRNVILKEKVMHMFLTGNYTQKQIGMALNISPATVHRILAEPQIREAIEKYQEEEDAIVTSALKALRMKALNKAAELIEHGENEMVSAILIRDILDRTGHKPVDKKEVNVQMTYEERLKELAKGVVVEDVDYEVIDDDSKETNTEGEERKW